jgi:hypothetical protein
LILRFTRDFEMVPFRLRLHREARIDPRLQPAEDGSDFDEAILQQNERRTGAGVLVQSGAVGNDPLVFIERHTGRI